jgi:hypothetical protein
MIHRWSLGLVGGLSVLCLVGLGSAWGVPHHDFDKSWGQGKHDYEDKYDDKHGKKGKGGHSYAKKDYDKWPQDDDWGDLKKYVGEHEYKSYGKPHYGKGYGKHKYGKDDPYYPPVPTPEPGTLLLLGSSLAAAGVYLRRRRT